MTQVRRFWPLLTGTHRYDKSLSTRGRGTGQIIEAPILAYLIETANGRILYDVCCDYTKISDPAMRAHYYGNPAFAFGPPQMSEGLLCGIGCLLGYVLRPAAKCGARIFGITLAGGGLWMLLFG